MKKINLFYSLCAFALFTSLVSCSKDEDFSNDNVDNSENTDSDVVTPELVKMDFTAGFSIETKTSLQDDNGVIWNANDAISVFDGSGNRKFTTTEGGESVTFTGEAIEADSYIALYPYSEDNNYNDGKIYLTIPSEQQAVPGTFATGLNPSWAQTSKDSKSFQFKNIAALIKINLPYEIPAAKKIILSAKGGETLTANYTLSVNENAVLSDIGGSTSSTVSLIAPADGFKSNVDYYFVVAPVTLQKGLTLKIVDSDENVILEKSLEGSQELTAGKIKSLPALSSTKKFQITQMGVYGGFNEAYGLDNYVSILNKDAGDYPYWNAENAADVELDNILTFTVTSMNDDGTISGTLNNAAGADNKYAIFDWGIYYPSLPVGESQLTNADNNFRRIPIGESTWSYNTIEKSITFTKNGESHKAKIFQPGESITHPAANWVPEGQDTEVVITMTNTGLMFNDMTQVSLDWVDNLGGNLHYSAYDRIMRTPREFYIQIKEITE